MYFVMSHETLAYVVEHLRSVRASWCPSFLLLVKAVIRVLQTSLTSI